MPKWIKYSAAEEQFLRDRETMPRIELTREFNARFNRSISDDNIKAKCLRMGLKTGRTGQIQPGNVPANKGTKGISGIHPNCRKTQFKKGHKPPNYRGPGAERVDKEGYIWVCVAETNPHTDHATRFVLKHRRTWEKEKGRIPKGCIIKFVDGDRTNCNIENLRMITKGENAILNRWGMGDVVGEALDSAINLVRLKMTLAGKRRAMKKKGADHGR